MRLALADGEGIPRTESPAGSGQWIAGSDYDFVVNESGSDFVMNYDNGQKQYFDTDGRLFKRVDVQGRETKIDYASIDPAAPLTQITGPYGYTLDLAYTDNRLTSVTDAEGDVYGYVYVSEKRLQTVMDPLNAVRTYHYEDAFRPGLLTGITCSAVEL